jgi:RNA polymerase sigma-70 factor (ECF subfamily)
VAAGEDESEPLVLDVVHLIFTTGHTAPAGARLFRRDLVDSAIGLARMLHLIMRNDAEVARMDDVRGDEPPEPIGPVEDDRLRLVFTCCHPALAPENRVALTLRLLGGLTVPEIASAFLVSETTMGQRITRAKKKIAAAKIPYRVPSAQDLPSRLAGVLAVLYLVFNEGYLATSGPTPVRVDLTSEAIRLCRVLRSL